MARRSLKIFRGDSAAPDAEAKRRSSGNWSDAWKTLRKRSRCSTRCRRAWGGLEARVGGLDARLGSLETQFLQFRQEVLKEFSAVRLEMRVMHGAALAHASQLHQDALTEARIMHEELVNRITLLSER